MGAKTKYKRSTNKREKMFYLPCRQINPDQNTLRSHLASVRVAVIEMVATNTVSDEGRKEPLYTAGRNVNDSSHCGTNKQPA